MCEFSSACGSEHIYAPHGYHVCHKCHIILEKSGCDSPLGQCNNGIEANGAGSVVCRPACGEDPRAEDGFDIFVYNIRANRANS